MARNRKYGSLLLLFFGLNCVEAPLYTETKTFNETIPTQGAKTLSLNVPFAIDLVGTNQSTIEIDLQLTLSASSAEASKAAIDQTTIEAQYQEETGTLSLGLSAPQSASVGGDLRIQVPNTVALNITSRGPRTLISGVREQITVNGLGNISIAGAERDVVLRAEGGTNVIDTLLLPGTTVDLQAAAGNLQVSIPLSASAQITAVEPSKSQIFINHPNLPRFIPGQPRYQASVRGGLATLNLSTGRGQILIGAR